MLPQILLCTSLVARKDKEIFHILVDYLYFSFGNSLFKSFAFFSHFCFFDSILRLFLLRRIMLCHLYCKYFFTGFIICILILFIFIHFFKLRYILIFFFNIFVLILLPDQSSWMKIIWMYMFFPRKFTVFLKLLYLFNSSELLHYQSWCFCGIYLTY